MINTYITYFDANFCFQLNTIYYFPEVSKYCKPSVILCSSTMRLALDDIFYHVTFKEVQFLLENVHKDVLRLWAILDIPKYLPIPDVFYTKPIALVQFLLR